MINVLIVDDSQVVAMLIKLIIEQEPDMQVIGIASDGREAVRMAHELKPDIITMDICMPGMDGFEATRMIMNNDPTPIVVVSSSIDDEEMRGTFRAIENGALQVIEKPHGPNHPRFEHCRRELVEALRTMSDVKVIRRRKPAVGPVDIFEDAIRQGNRAFEIVMIGCSTGGPQALRQVLGSLPVGFPVPIAIVQHISTGFIAGLVSWLQGNSLLNIKLAEKGEKLQASTVYLAPDGFHLQVRRNGAGLCADLSDSEAVSGFKPSATLLFNSAAKHCPKHAIAGLLTGMGDDGASGLLEARRAGCHTFVQDEKSAVVYGMPGMALAIDAVDQIVELDKIAPYLTSLVQQ